MKTTLEIPDATFRKAKSQAAQKGISLRDFVTQALEEKMRSPPTTSKRGEPEWLRFAGAFGKTATQRQETRRIQEAIDREFETIDAEDLD
ncbi:MAG: hypothetical protein ACXW32_05825 [Limisphaerales bacterium]